MIINVKNQSHRACDLFPIFLWPLTLTRKWPLPATAACVVPVFFQMPSSHRAVKQWSAIFTKVFSNALFLLIFPLTIRNWSTIAQWMVCGCSATASWSNFTIHWMVGDQKDICRLWATTQNLSQTLVTHYYRTSDNLFCSNQSQGVFHSFIEFLQLTDLK